MKKNEIILLIVTLIVLGGGLYLQFAPEETGEGEVAAVTAGDLETAADKFQTNLKLLKKGAGINEEFKRFQNSMEDSQTAGDPGMAATTQLFNVLHDQLGIEQPVISISREELIKNVEEYYFINVTVKVGGPEAEMKKLLRNMEELGFLIKSFKMGGENHGMNDRMDLEVVVSRLVKHTKESRERMGLGGTKGGRRSIGRRI